MTDIAAFGFPGRRRVRAASRDRDRRGDSPGSSFYRDAASGRTKIRFCFCKKDETLDAAEQRLAGLCRKMGNGAMRQ